MRADRRNPVINKLRRAKATKFQVTLRDATVREVPLSTKANKWEKLLDVLEKLPWVTIEAQSDAGATLEVIENDDPDDDEDEDEEVEDYDPVAAAVERISKQMMSVMIQTQQETRKGYEATMRGFADMTRSMVDAVTTLRDTYTTALRIQDLAGLGRPASDDGIAGSSENMMKLLMMASSLLQQSAPGPKPPVTIAPTINVTQAPKAAAPTAPKNGVAPKS